MSDGRGCRSPGDRDRPRPARHHRGEDPARCRQDTAQHLPHRHRRAVARADDRPLHHLDPARVRARRERLVAGLLEAEPRHLVELRRALPQPRADHRVEDDPYIAVGNTLLVVVLGAMAGYAFAWLEFPGRDWAFIGVIALLVVPLQMALIPMFRVYDKLHLYDTWYGIALFHVAFGLPFAIFLLRNFFVGLPKDILESARIDGASEIVIFLRLILPLGLPAIASLAIFQFLWTWNDLLVALTFGRTTQPITVAIFSQLGEFGSNIEIIAPAAFLSLVIPLAVFFAFQRYFVQGLLAGSVK